MDINNHHKFAANSATTTSSWDSLNVMQQQLPIYNMMMMSSSTTTTTTSATISHPSRIFLHHENPFDPHTQWPAATYYQNTTDELPSSSIAGYLPSLSNSQNYLLSTADDDGRPKDIDDHNQEIMEDHEEDEDEEELGAMKEMMFKIAAMQPVDIDPATIRKPRRRNVRISDDPQSVAARHRRERISEKVRILQRLVPGGTKMDTATMLDEAIRYVKFLKRQIRILQQNPPPGMGENQAATSPYLFGGGGNDDDNDRMAAGDNISSNPMFFNHN